MKNSIFKVSKISFKRVIISLLIVLVLGAIIFYSTLPALNIHSTECWTFIGFLLVVFLVLTLSAPWKSLFENKDMAISYNIVTKIVGAILVLGIVVYIVGGIWGAEIFNAKKYASLIGIENTTFEDTIPQEEVISNIALMDTSSAKAVGKRAIGALSEVVSQYTISEDYTQIALNSAPMKVATLEYAGFFKWFNNKSKGIPGYVLVDAVEFEASYVKLEKSIKYTTSGWFGDNLQRHLRFKYPTAIFEGYYFELDEEGKPYYVCPTMTARVGLFAGKDVNGVVICDPCSGDTKYYKLGEIPNWVDRVYDGDLIEQKYNWYGMLNDGYLNSVIGQKGCKVTTEDYGYKVMDNDVWIYTGITSVIDDSSNIGFILVNARTGEAKYFDVAGAEEFSAMSAAEGQVQHLGYNAAFPSLINVDGRPTYFMVLKDKGNLVKQYALVDVKKYSIVATGTTQKETLATYRKLLRENDVETKDNNSNLEEIYQSANIVVKEINYIETGDGTTVYIRDVEGNVYKQLFENDETMIFIQENDNIIIYYETDEATGIKNIESWEFVAKETAEETTISQ